MCDLFNSEIMKKLIPMVDFILEQNEIHYTIQSEEQAFYIIVNYANFLKQPLELWMFVPCDDNGNVIDVNNRYETENDHLNIELDNSFIQAKERVLFDGFELKGETELSWIFSLNNNFPVMIFKKYTIENLSKLNITLTKSAIKQIGL